MHGLDRRWPYCGIELEPHLEGIDMLPRFLDQALGRVEVRNIERERDARPWIVLIHESPQQRYGAA
jgi:hypothetical protein